MNVSGNGKFSSVSVCIWSERNSAARNGKTISWRCCIRFLGSVTTFIKCIFFDRAIGLSVGNDARVGQYISYCGILVAVASGNNPKKI